MSKFTCEISGDIDIYDLREMIWWLKENTGVEITAEINKVTKEEEINETKTSRIN